MVPDLVKRVTRVVRSARASVFQDHGSTRYARWSTGVGPRSEQFRVNVSADVGVQGLTVGA
jgi:hypothetical protein